MAKKYLHIILFIISFTTTTVVAQESKSSQKSIETSIEGLSFYLPNQLKLSEELIDKFLLLN